MTKTKRLLATFLALTMALATACGGKGDPGRVGAGLTGATTFPTTTSIPLISNGETVGPNIATALNQILATLYQDELYIASGNAGLARTTVTLLSGAYTGSGTGTLTASANAAFGTQDSVATLVVGDVVLLPAGLANVTAAKDAGPYVILNMGSGSTKWVLTRPAWWLTGAACGSIINVSGESTIFGGTQWFSYAAKGTVIDTTDCQLYPDVITTQITLVAGTKTITSFPIRSTSLTTVCPVLRTTGGTVTTTVGYQPTALVAGAIGTGSFTIQAEQAGLTINASDTSTLNVLITN